ncbi:MAG: hypothetical protein IJR87_05510 [Bacteroidaceae bacterium]|nr:hypothetical protein [Bacteroidaceae bacterium]
MKREILLVLAALCLLPGGMRAQQEGPAEADSAEVEGLSLNVPYRLQYPTGFRTSPYGFAPLGSGFGWPGSALSSFGPLHYGLNAEAGAGVRVGWGRHNPWRGASFFTDMAALYAMPVSKDGRWTAALGGYYSNYRMWGEPVNRLGLTGLVDYRINDKLNLTGFVAHDFGAVGGRRLHGPGLWGTGYDPWLTGYGLGYGPATTVGADLGIQLTEKMALSIGVSMTRQQPDFPYGINAIPPARQQMEQRGLNQ